MQDGNSPVSDFLQELTDLKAHKKILRDFEEKIEKYPFGMLLQAEVLKKMKGYEKYKLYEYKLLYNKTQYRILCSIHGSTCYLVHAFIKKEQKTRNKHLQTAVSRIISHIPIL